MKKRKLLLSILTCVSIAGSTFGGYYVSAETEDDIPRYTYYELMEMSDEEIIKNCGIDEEFFGEIGFGNDAISDEKKFKNYWPDIWSGIEYYEDERYMWREAFLNGEYTPYFRLHVSDDVNLDSSLLASDFGFPAEWDIELCRGVLYGPEEDREYWLYHSRHDYQITVTKELFEDFETYFRFEIAGMNCSDMFGDLGITGFSTPADVMAPLSTQPEAVILGDINDSDSVDISDAVSLMAHATNPEAYPLSDLQLLLGDVYQQGDGIGINDAVSIQKYLTKQIDSLPESAM